ncbi:hypothetical protein, partial [Bradyrhizobium sp. Leo170]|uniref:hypothetical protein n=1 Tax=Bradyrhizobium sp. Leo170 TaxID=1571199 RepID=UPI001A9247CE
DESQQTLDHDPIGRKRIMISSPCLSMTFSENRFPLSGSSSSHPVPVERRALRLLNLPALVIQARRGWKRCFRELWSIFGSD